MATYPPPNYTETLSVFNPENWIVDYENNGLTQAEADLLYLKFPVAQGLETLQQIVVNGTADFNSSLTASTNIVMDGTALTNYLQFPDGTQQFTASLAPSSLLSSNNIWTGTNEFQNTTAMDKPLTMSGTLNTDRIISNVYYQLQDANSIGSVLGSIYAGTGVFNYDNDTNGGSHNFATNTAGGAQTIPLNFNSVDMTIATTNPPTCSASSTILLTDDSSKLPSTAWVRDYVASAIPSTPTTFVSTATTTAYNSGGNYTYWYFTSFPSWNAFSWVFNTPTTSKTNVAKTNLGSSPPLAVGTISNNGSFILMTGSGVSQGYTATSSTMITYCAGFQQNYTISAGATALILSVVNCIGATPATPIFQSNNLSENGGTCPPTANPLSGYIILQALNGNYTGLGTPTLTFTQIIA